LIRETEATSAARYCGVHAADIHFLNLPFYESGTEKKNELSSKDVDIVADLLEQVKPHQIYAAGDLSDPHGTHVSVCKQFSKLSRGSERESGSKVAKSGSTVVHGRSGSPTRLRWRFRLVRTNYFKNGTQFINISHKKTRHHSLDLIRENFGREVKQEIGRLRRLMIRWGLLIMKEWRHLCCGMSQEMELKSECFLKSTSC